LEDKERIETELGQKEQEVLKSLSLTKIILPVFLGLFVILYLVFKNFDVEEFSKIEWNQKLWTYLGLAVLVYILRHLFYAYRLKILSDNQFTFKHAIELVVIWEFASAISPTSIGGSAVAVFFLSQEKISAAKAVSIVLYTVIIDTIFFLLSLVIMLSLLGPKMIYPELASLMEPQGWLFITVWTFMFIYGGILTWGLFKPTVIKNILGGLAKLPLIRRFKKPINQTGEDVMLTSEELRKKPLSFHIKATILTIGAWVTKFLIVNFLIMAFVEMDWTFADQFLVFARSETMHVITQFSPTPGGSGVMEYYFPKFFGDYISEGIGSVVALLWRLITYYPYLIIGAIIIPNWVRRVIKSKRNKQSV